MSTCTKWVTKGVITCKNWATMVDYECTTWADKGSNQCSQWADEGSNQCSQWADEGSNQCSQWADEGSNQCTSWEKCHWYTPWNCIAGFFCRAWYWVAKWVCKAWYWVAKWVCKAWYWVAKWVCKAWYWVAKWVCKAFAWVVKAVCVVLGWVFSLVCLAWDSLRCALVSLWRAIVSMFGGRESRPKVDHVFVLMLENRSFDHMLGFSGLKGTGIDDEPTTLDGADPSRDQNPKPGSETEAPVSTPAEFWLKGVDEDPGHEFHNTLVSLCGEGATYDPALPYPPIDNSGFIANYADSGSSTPERIMHCYLREQVPVLTALAEEFAVCDAWFSSLPGPTWPNRFFLMAATSGGLDDSPSTLDIVTATTVEGYRFANGNLFDLLDDACIEWRIFEGDEFPVSFALSGMNLNALQGRFKDFEDFATEVGESSFGPRFVFIEPQYGAHGFDVTGPGDFACGNSMHPLDDVTRGERLVKTVYEAIRNSPHWEKSMLVIVFDEHGGFYDHVNPPAAVPPGDTFTQSYIKNQFKFDQLGVRVPAVVVSPLIKKGVIDHTIYDHSSVPATVERLFGMSNLTARDKAANDLLHLLSLETPRTDTPATLPDPYPFGVEPPLVPVNPTALPCDEDSEDGLVQTRSELRQAQAREELRGRSVEAKPPTPTQVGFAQVALMKVLQTAPYPEREAWIEQFKAISTSLDAALFVTEAKLKVRHGVDLALGEHPNRKLRQRVRQV